ncbi:MULTISPECIES: S53 family peptidase [Bradyrhizobium]|uniref:S53 family peptidase n=1 Tax=Bradyrhizobium TaxID=374 RepID=UPI001EDC6B6F|nr:S53 family peptidase [Bradyrhizobium zhengyangense]MCG2645276.1 S53 family peptidase [Bradyrhizobium zhengyangense]
MAGVAPKNGPSKTEDEIKADELHVRQIEAEKALKSANAPWWRRADPLTLAILAAAGSLVGNILSEHSKAKDDQALEQTKAQYNLVLQAMATNDAAAAKRNIHFFIDAGLLADGDCRIRNAIDSDNPVLPSLSGTAPAGPANLLSPPLVASLYNFPPGVDGRGQTIGIVEFGGGFDRKDLEQYFSRLKLPVPEIIAVPVNGGGNHPSMTDDGTDMQTAMDIEIAAGTAPRAHLKVYFAPVPKTEGFNAADFAQAVRQATADQVSVLLIGWGLTESQWKDEDIKLVDGALEQAAKQGITVIAPSGENGVTDGMTDGRRHVSYPASSPWVLSVGGTTVKIEDGKIKSEKIWRDGQSATGGGVSEKFARPDWQNGVKVPLRADGSTGRGLPDVVATADPAVGYTLFVHGNAVVVGGTGAVVPLWGGLIALLNQANGHNLGYVTPRFYREFGPAKLFREITEGDNGVSGVTGFKAGPGWTPVAGWGSPDGVKLINWLRTHPDGTSTAANVTACPATTSQ